MDEELRDVHENGVDVHGDRADDVEQNGNGVPQGMQGGGLHGMDGDEDGHDEIDGGTND
jgi:hypothetical protein